MHARPSIEALPARASWTTHISPLGLSSWNLHESRAYVSCFEYRYFTGRVREFTIELRQSCTEEMHLYGARRQCVPFSTGAALHLFALLRNSRLRLVMDLLRERAFFGRLTVPPKHSRSIHENRTPELIEVTPWYTRLLSVVSDYNPGGWRNYIVSHSENDSGFSQRKLYPSPFEASVSFLGFPRSTDSNQYDKDETDSVGIREKSILGP